MEEMFSAFGGSNLHWKQRAVYRDCAKRLISQHGLPKVKKAIHFARRVQGVRFAPQVTNPLQLEDKWEQLLAYSKRA